MSVEVEKHNLEYEIDTLIGMIKDIEIDDSELRHQLEQAINAREALYKAQQEAQNV